MAIVNKFLWLICVIIFYCSSVFAVQVQIIEIGHRDYKKVNAYIDEVAQKAGESTTVLKVYINDYPEVVFSSGKNKIPGSMRPEDFFKDDSFHQEAACLLYEHNFPIDKFYFPMILEKGISNVSQMNGKGVRLFTGLEKNLFALKALKASLDVLRDPSMEIPKGVIEERIGTTQISVQKDVKDYVGEKGAEEEIWLLCEKLFQASYHDIEVPPGTPKSIFEEIEFKNKTIGSRISMLDKEKKILPIILSSLPESERELKVWLEKSVIDIKDNSELREMQLRLYCRYWGKHAEDALIYKILTRFRDYRQIPRVIEIYGSEDPCFQCQIKLQWLADHLAEISSKFGGINTTPITIIYYSKRGACAQCLYIGMPPLVVNCFTTRKPEEISKIKQFVFIAQDSSSSSSSSSSHPLEAFMAPIKILKANKLLRPRMLSGQYEGEILEVTKSDDGGVILKIEIKRILHASLAYQPEGVIPVNPEICQLDDLDELCKLYNSKKKVCIYLSPKTIPSGQQFDKNSKISFNIVDNIEDVPQELEEIGKDGFYGSGVLKSL